jgi:HPt (histidine-containing phosphotransfer) domain-containing protein
MPDAADKVAKALAVLWERNRPLVEERLAALDRAAAGSGDEALRQEGIVNAHKLAGSLGLYGYDEGTRIAREIEVLLGRVPYDVARLRMLCRELRAVIFPVG